MVAFKIKKIKTENTVGEILKSLRISANIELDQAARDIKVSKDYLQWLEDSEYSKLPGEVYAKNFIKAYGIYLKLNHEDLLKKYKKERDVYNNLHSSNTLSREPVRLLSRLHFLSAPKIARNAIVSLVVFVLLLYLGFKVEAIIRPPDLIISNPISDILIDAKFIDVEGYTLPGSHVAINGQKVIVGEDGSFSEKVNLSDGINEIKISAKKDHSKENIIYRRVVVKEKET